MSPELLAKIRANIRPLSITELYPEQVERFIKYGVKYVYCAMCVEDQPNKCLILDTIESIYGHLEAMHEVDEDNLKYHAKRHTTWPCCWPRCKAERELATQDILDHYLCDHFEYRG